MKFKDKYPDFAAVEDKILAARAERAAFVAQAIVDGIGATLRGMNRLARFVGRNVTAEADRRAINADAFLKRSVPKY